MAATTQMDIRQSNMLARNMVLGSAVDMTQKIFSTTFSPTSQSVLNITPRNVGLIKGFYVIVDATIENTGVTDNLVRTSFGPSNVLSQVTFNDLNNNVRIQDAGWHLNLINTVKRRHVMGAAYTNDSPVDFGSNYDVISAPATIAPSSTGAVKMIYYIPLAYNDDDLRGSVYAGVVNATMNLQLTLNTSPVVASGDATLALYSGNTGGYSGNVTVTVYQNYLDQLPMGKQGPLLPALDLATIYELKNTALTGLSVGQDFPVPYANFRDFISTSFVFDNGGTLNAGSDINYIALQSANYTNMWKIEPRLAALWTRNEILDDTPAGVYYFSHRRRPLATIQYGNLEMIINPSTVNSGAVALVGFEAFSLVNQITSAGSLAAG